MSSIPDLGPRSGGHDTEDGKRAMDKSTGSQQEHRTAYWQANLRIVAGLLTIWFVVSYVFGILLAEPLNAVNVPLTGYPLGFWFAQQGSIYVFVALIFVYVFMMNRLDKQFGVSEDED
jgi:putative solute:sodium symporter small subunit